MRPRNSVAPAAAVASMALSWICCLPLGLAGGAAAGALAVVLAPLRPWLMGLSIVLLAAGFEQLRRNRRACRSGGRGGATLLIAATLLVAASIVFPQEIAGLLADWLPW